MTTFLKGRHLFKAIQTGIIRSGKICYDASNHRSTSLLSRHGEFKLDSNGRFNIILLNSIGAMVSYGQSTQQPHVKIDSKIHSNESSVYTLMHKYTDVFDYI